MINTTILSWVTFIFFAAFVFYLFRMILGREFWGKLATWTALVGLVAQSIALIIRWKTSYDLGMGHAPLSNFYESLIFFAWTIVFLYLLMEWRLKNRSIGVFVLPVAFLIMAYASIAPGISNRIEPLIPALQSNWLTSHVLTCFLGYAAFTVAFALGIMFFDQECGRCGFVQYRCFYPSAAFRISDGRPDVFQRRLGIYFSDFRDCDRLGLGALCLGIILELGPEGNLVADYLAGLCRDAAHAFGARLAW